MGMTPQQRAAKTRASNRAYKRLYEEISKPAHQKVEKLLNGFLVRHDVRLRWVGPWRLKRGVTSARLFSIDHGGLGFTVHIDGYSLPKHYSSQFWEIAE
jgi:hypothetical protein